MGNISEVLKLIFSHGDFLFFFKFTLVSAEENLRGVLLRTEASSADRVSVESFTASRFQLHHGD